VDTGTRSPCFALLISGENMIVQTRSDSAFATTSNPQPTDVVGWVIEKGKVVDFELQAKWSFGADGETSIYKDGSLVFQSTGPNCYNDTHGPYPKLGIYHWQEFPSYIHTQTLFMSDLVITDVP